MKILIVSTVMPSPANDGLRISLNISLSSLITENDCDFIGSYNDLKEIELTQKEFPKLNILFLNKFRISCLNRLKALFTGQPPAVMSCYDSKIKKKVKKALFANDYDILLFYSITACYYLPKRNKVPSILSVNDAISYAYSQRLHSGNFLYNTYMRLNYKRILKVEREKYIHFDAIHVVSQVDKKILEKANRKLSIYEIPIIAPKEFFLPRLAHEKISILYCINRADPNPINGIEDILEMARDFLISNNIKVKLICGNYIEQLQPIVRSYPNVEAIEFVNEFAEELRRTDIFLALDSVGSGLKNRVLQAMAAGCCVIGTPIALEGFKYTNGEHAFCEESMKLIVERLEDLLRDESKISTISKNARENMYKNYSFQIASKKWNELCIQLALLNGDN